MLHGWAGTSFPCVQSMRTGKVNRKRPAHTLNRRRSSRAANGGGGEEGLALAWYGPGTSLTEWTGSIPDTAELWQLRVKQAHAMENEQCYGRKTSLCL